MNITEITRAIAPLVKLAQRELEAALVLQRREREVERNEYRRKYAYIEAQRDKWKADALRLRKQAIMFRTKQKEKHE